MAFAEWDRALETGNLMVDTQHRELFAAVNQLHDAILAHNDIEVLGGILYRLQRYTAVHFRDEEDLMAQVAYPDAAGITGCISTFTRRPPIWPGSTSRASSPWASRSRRSCATGSPTISARKTAGSPSTSGSRIRACFRRSPAHWRAAADCLIRFAHEHVRHTRGVAPSFGAVRRRHRRADAECRGQVRLGCTHCHQQAGPGRTEVMTDDVYERAVALALAARPQLVDITGGAPELYPRLAEMVATLTDAGLAVRVRTNLVSLGTPDKVWLAEFFAEKGVRLLASFPSADPAVFEAQRGPGTFERGLGDAPSAEPARLRLASIGRAARPRPGGQSCSGYARPVGRRTTSRPALRQDLLDLGVTLRPGRRDRERARRPVRASARGRRGASAISGPAARSVQPRRPPPARLPMRDHGGVGRLVRRLRLQPRRGAARRRRVAADRVRDEPRRGLSRLARPTPYPVRSSLPRLRQWRRLLLKRSP